MLFPRAATITCLALCLSVGGEIARAAGEAPPKAHAPGALPPSVPPEALSSAAEARFTALRYDEAITLYRRYLRHVPKDYKAWSKLGAAYFYTGQPRKALRTLKHVERRTPEKSYNYYYQGLCYLLLAQPTKAHDFLQYAAAKFSDDWSAKAIYEVAVLDYKAKSKDKATYWIAQYLEKHPKGPQAPEMRRIQLALKEDKPLDDVQGTPLPDTEKALFKYSPLSLTPKPHYWFLSGGGRYQAHDGKEPDQNGKINDLHTEEEAAIFNTGVGIGPLRYGTTTITAGYTYRQIWHTDADRVDQWLNDWTDFLYFPLRSDVMERRHQMSFDLRHDLGSSYFFGVYARYELARIGSSFFPNPEIQELQQAIPISDTQLLIPWIGYIYNSTMRTLAYFYLRKEINDNQPAYSNQTFTLQGDTGRPTLSMGISHTMDFPDIESTLDLEIYHYEFVYNDKWLDYARNGAFVSFENRLFLSLSASVLAGFYDDSYTRQQIKTVACGNQPDLTAGGAKPAANAKGPHGCDRNDTGTLLQAGGSWTFTQNQRVEGYFQLVKNANATLEEYQDEKTSIQVSFTMAFPSVKRVSRIVDRYADSAFTKEQQ